MYVLTDATGIILAVSRSAPLQDIDGLWRIGATRHTGATASTEVDRVPSDLVRASHILNGTDVVPNPDYVAPIPDQDEELLSEMISDPGTTFADIRKRNDFLRIVAKRSQRDSDGPQRR